MQHTTLGLVVVEEELKLGSDFRSVISLLFFCEIFVRVFTIYRLRVMEIAITMHILYSLCGNIDRSYYW